MLAIETPVMAKKKSKPRSTEGWTTKPIIMQMRGSAEFKAWLEALADHDRLSVAEMTERAVIEYARRIGFLETPPKR